MSMFRCLRLFPALILLALCCAGPVRAEEHTSLFASLSARHEDGSPLLGLALEGGCDFDPASGSGPICRAALRDARVDTPLFSGPARGGAVVELAPEKLLLREVTLRMPGAMLTLAEERALSVNLTLTGSGQYVPALGEWTLDKATLATDAGLVLSGSMSMTPDRFAARLAVNLRDPQALAGLLGMDAATRDALPSGPVVLDLAAEGGPDAFGPLGLNLVTTASLRDGLRLGGVDVPPLRLSARPVADGDGWLLRHLVLSTGDVFLGGEVRLGPAGGVRAELAGTGVPLEKLAPTVQAMTGLPLTQWSPGGELDLKATADLAEGRLRCDAGMALHDAAYMSPMAEYMGQGLDASFTLGAALDLAAGTGKVRAKADIRAGEVLFGAAYLNLGEHPLAASARATLAGPSRFKDLTASVDWKGLALAHATADLTASGPLPEWRCAGTLTAEQVDLGPWFDIGADALALENFQGANGLEGLAGLELALKADGETADLDGLLTVEDGALTTQDKSLEVRGARVRLPLAYRLRGPVVNLSPQYVLPRQWGSISAGLVRAPGILLRDAATEAALAPNRFFVREGLDVSLLGGRVRLSGMQCDRPFSKDMELRAGVRLQGLDLAEADAGAFPLQGRLEGNLGTVSLTRKALAVPGSVGGTFFGGTVLVDGMHVDDPFQAYRRVGLSVTVREMDLERLSTAMDVGRVTGLMDLDLHDILLAYGQPVGMRLRAETSGEGDFERSVSIKAVNSLSVIGTGSGMGDLGVGLFAGFFEEFSYDRIGFQCVLNNDIFRVRGLVREDGVEYLIKKPFLMGINVVNSNPNNNISFKDMLERVRRVLGENPRSAPGA